VRAALAIILVIVATALTFPATLAVWQQRVLMDTPSFVDVGNDVLSRDAVKDALAGRLASEVTLLEPRVQDSTARNLARAFLDNLPESAVAETALSSTHALVVRLIREENLETEDDTIVFDLLPVVRQVLNDSGLANVPLNEGAGRIVLVRSEDLTASLRTARFLDGAAPFVVAAPAVVLLLALIVAPSRSLLLVFAGLAIAAAAALRILLLESEIGDELIDAALLQPDARAAAIATYDVLAAVLIEQDLFVVLIGAMLAGIGVVSAVVGRHDDEQG
jgi:hypothetical protein